MITKEYPISVACFFLEKTGISPETCLLFDIETTGLSWRRSHLYLLGAVFYTPEGWLQKQWFCQRPRRRKRPPGNFFFPSGTEENADSL